MGAFEPREYQTRTLEMLYAWLSQNNGNLCVSLPTGSGKSVVIAELCRQAVQQWPETRILMLTRSMELISQNAQKLRTIWPGAPMGIYSASVGQRVLGEPITIGGPLSIVRVLDKIGHCDLLIVDEAHDISHKDEGSYRKIIDHLLGINSNMRVIGFTASPFRLGHGLITDKPAIFDAIIEPVSIEELIFKEYLSVLRSKVTSFKLSTEGVHKRGGEFVESELQEAVDTEENNAKMVQEVIARSEGRKSWMFFCAGVRHAQRVRDLLQASGVNAVCVTGDMPKAEREQVIDDFKAGRIKAITQINCLSTGFDHAALDLLVLARPTMSPGLYLQQVGRGMRVAEGKKDCLVLDFAGVVSTHGPITAVQTPKRGGDGNGEAPVKVCDNCDELCHLSLRECPACGAQFPEPERQKLTLHDDDIMGLEGQELEVASWMWRKHTSKASGKLMLACTYYGPGLAGAAVTEYLPILHEGYAGDKAMRQLGTMADAAGAYLGGASGLDTDQGLEYMAAQMRSSKPPQRIEYRVDGKFHRVLKRVWA